MNPSSSPRADSGTPAGPAPPDIGVPDAFYRELLQTLNTGVAVVDPQTWVPIAENEPFFEWFPPGADVDGPLGERVPGLDVERAAARLDKGRPYTFEVEVKRGPRSMTIGLRLQRCTVRDTPVVVVEATDATKRAEAEHMLDSYARMADKNARDLQREKERAEKLLLNIMPRSVFEEMKDFGSVTPTRFDEATILMLDFVGFTDMAVSRDPGALVSELNDIFSAFDRITELFGCERMKTIGDAYMAVSGIPERNEDHAQNIARVALRMRRYLEKRNTSHREPWLGRIGIHSGPVVGSIVGVQKYVYDIFGPGVNMAARMEALSEPMQITVSEATWERIQTEFICSGPEEVEVKGFGKQRIYSLDGELERGR